MVNPGAVRSTSRRAAVVCEWCNVCGGDVESVYFFPFKISLFVLALTSFSLFRCFSLPLFTFYLFFIFLSFLHFLPFPALTDVFDLSDLLDVSDESLVSGGSCAFIYTHCKLYIRT
jgi:hypothetical protein